jgi:hypothetical protein
MDKEEILAKSRLENKGRDMAAIEESRSSARFAVLFGFFFMAVLAVLSLISHNKMIYGVAAMEFCIVFAMNIFNAVKKKERKYIILSLTTGMVFLMFTYITVCEIFQIYP